VVNGIVYFGSRDGKVYAVDALTGEKKWDFQTGSFVLASPVVADGVVYIGSNDGYLYALNALTGKKVWSFYTKYAVMSASAVAGGVIYFGADDSKFHALDVTTGKEIWSSTTGSQIRGSAVVTNGIVYFGSDDGNLYALGARDGKFRLHFLSAPVLGSPAAVGTTIWFTNQTGYLFSIDGMARNWPWEYDIKPLWLQAWAMHIAPQPPRLSGLLTGVRLGSKSESSPSIKDNSLFVGIDFNLVGYDIKNETTLWTFKTGGNVYSSPATAGGVVYVGSEDGNIYAVDATTGKELWHVQTGDKIVSSPALANGVLYIGSFDGKLYAIK
jgi:outer membrane protein assembly factor BamB